ncbi:outer membrane lipid asymmetry maintenance protein MlaD [Desulfovibrio legallii]|jgi:phospholipid/cholesterol/gamma-HCH transport system substrate-binding protein|uniref:Outer membrane lipid asymmetry maintenance protein MlaD n=1 Tax=Desulfovibrio legallii TaxID=571438 RepID=A0A6H3FCE9_9BACT|nr:outer membrane lipid asymmetry maintenance protein MlaD [Desulfovibrio legallii]RHH20535.1 outer membrane lipid asymmetry maintenance protein MlaD [Desulfovibrio sp. AM18-2]TBH80512.1 outer membrane lipid asymmetry maintenance protein MlaD [Desulfovibrio legallii]CAI3241262.1 Phospholipid ABC transporter substrate-binding protein MlaD [Desulfovibrio diazotrophicus]
MNSARETAVGLFVLLGLLCVAYLTVKLGKMELFSSQGFELVARFDSVSGLRVGADVEMSGVPVGRVVDIRLDPDPLRNQAVVRLRLNKDLQLSDDSMASVRTSGLIGDKYVSLSRGGSDQILSSGGAITETESAVDLGALISKYAFGGVK